jgi:hypothetical protein
MQPLAINPAGAVTGDYTDANFSVHGFLRARDGTITTFDAPGAVFGTLPTAINPAGVVTGLSLTQTSGHGFLRARDGTFTTFDAPGAVGTQPSGINPAGAVTGYYVDENAGVHGFLLSR